MQSTVVKNLEAKGHCGMGSEVLLIALSVFINELGFNGRLELDTGCKSELEMESLGPYS